MSQVSKDQPAEKDERCECGRGKVALCLRICAQCLAEAAADFWAEAFGGK